MVRNMRKQAFVLGVALSLGATRWAFAETCMLDTDCTELGSGCGTDVCSWAVTPHTCVAAATHDPGWCHTTADCKCAPQGATCQGTSCTFIVLNEDDGGPYPLVPGPDAGPSGTGASDGGGSDGGAAVGEPEAGAPDGTATEEAGRTSSSGGSASVDASSSNAVDASLSGGSNEGVSKSSSGGCSAGGSSGAGWGVAVAFLGGFILIGRQRRGRSR